MSSWVWFVVALVVVDLAVVVTWFALRHRSAAAAPGPATGHSVDAETRTEVAALVTEHRTAEAMALLRRRTGMPLREAKDTVDAMTAGVRASRHGAGAPRADHHGAA
ncbi:hypothetical protein [Rhodococcoides corynebacterioides]|uniref:Ribosomal protein L7/L12 C-terminal domain-containing protein n=1 Tax=Rhodococcoides corynebacterioides TaxID=53972 RepID=A0ABS7P1L3_9NOCA|nr:hypothetical protein [Rhodococcus corynebacterioides]MBY6366295.1 hypothetical protein [Rhodococcus corynebacterioides]MBY6406794.1 hypothetical protein [Rhodococcus corynebacterioides]